MPPSTLTLLGLVRHMAEVERTWFRRVIAGEDIPLLWSGQMDFPAAYDAPIRLGRKRSRPGKRRLSARARSRQRLARSTWLGISRVGSNTSRCDL
jgi:hypothetical protein